MAGNVPFKIESADPADLHLELDRILGEISERLDRIEGLSGAPTFFASLTTGFDVNFTGASRGVVLRDDGNPANFWRVTVNSSGTLLMTKLGTTL